MAESTCTQISYYYYMEEKFESEDLDSKRSSKSFVRWHFQILDSSSNFYKITLVWLVRVVALVHYVLTFLNSTQKNYIFIDKAYLAAVHLYRLYWPFGWHSERKMKHNGNKGDISFLDNSFMIFLVL